MTLGRILGNALTVPAVRLRSERERCIQCGRCSEVCPMSLAVQQMANRQAMDHTDCILCGACKESARR